jgi:hypothetical protein
MMRIFLLPMCLILGSAADAKEVSKVADITSESDWILADRNEWLIKRKSAIDSMMPAVGIPGVRFLNAFSHNVKNNKPGEYVTVGQRHALYDALSYTLHFVQDVPQALRCVRFFDAAADVTHTFNVGAVELFDLLKSAAGMSPATETLLTKINADLFNRNFKIIEKLMLTWREPRDPAAANPTQKLDAMDFDSRIVQFEQGAVEAFLAANNALVTPAVKNDLKASHAALDVVGQFLSGQGGAIARRKLFRETWLPAIGISTFDFFNKNHRVAMGEAYVFFLHGYDLAAYKKFKNQAVRPPASCKGTLPGVAAVSPVFVPPRPS